ncbi:MAG TPA: hypothetical protein DER01_18070, partial [Phycisphaerales bacterium]|nr:hypothetical protein [Phycisphaerales bacterium]
EAAQKLGYVSNHHMRSIRRGRADVLGLVLETDGPPGQGGRSTDYIDCITHGVLQEACQAEQAVQVIMPTSKLSAAEQGLKALRSGAIDGLVVPGIFARIQHASLLRDFASLPLVVIQPTEPTPYAAIDFNQAAGAQLSAQHLLELGHRELLWVGSAGLPGSADQIREHTFLSEILKARGFGSVCHIELLNKSASTEQWIELSDQQISTYFQQCPTERFPTGIACFNDLIAMGVIRALRRMNLHVPHDVSVVGFDNVYSVLQDPPLTTVDHRFSQMGQLAVQRLLELIDGGEKKYEQYNGHVERIEPELIIRTSTGQAKTQ